MPYDSTTYEIEETTADKLRRAKALIEDPENWCQGIYARDAKGLALKSREVATDGVAFCAIGALVRATQNRDVVWVDGKETKKLWEAAKELFGHAPARVNDNLGHAAVMHMYERAIELAEQDNAL